MARKPTVTNSQNVVHRLPGTSPGTSKPVTSDDDLNAFLGSLNNQTAERPTKKGEKPVIVLEGKADILLSLQQDKAEYKTLEGRIAQLEGELLPLIEEQRLCINIAKQQYINSVHVQATGNDALGKPIGAGQAIYYIQDRYSAFDPFALSADDELQSRYDGKATLRDEAAEAIMASLGVNRSTADGILKERMEVDSTVSIDPGALKDPEVLQILRQHLAKHLTSVTKMTPTTAFHEKSNYSEFDMRVMAALNEVGLCKRSKAVIKSSGAPAQ